MSEYKEWIKNKKKYFIVFVGVMFVSFYVSANWYQMVLIRGDSMFPTYRNMQLVIIDRHSCDYTYGDVVAFECEGLSSVLIKRVVACPGDKIIIKDGVLYVNDSISIVYSEDVLFEYAGIAADLIQLSDNQYFVIGDNVIKSKDSRYQKIGCIYANDILGRTIG